ncbi:MAG: hypothetical protein IKR57_03025 [Bacilli bacterium]|nr:hypothetical protein [Bacilli bacterium]
MKKYLIFIVGVVLIAVGIFIVVYDKSDDPKGNNPGGGTENPGGGTEVITDENFDFKIIKQADKVYNNNYLISPLSIGYALSILDSGAEGKTHEQISNYLGNFKTIHDVNVKDKISIANGLFIRNYYKNDISNDFVNNTKNNFNADVVYDDFVTPKVMNDWVSKNTYKMIDKIADNLSNDFVMGIVNTVAIDVEWQNTFECFRTRSEEFTLENGTKMQTAMMHSDDYITYIENENAKGIIKNYVMYDKTTGNKTYEKNNNTIQLEYIAILPNKTIKDYMNIFDKKELDNLLSNKKTSSYELEINLSLPKYTYDFTYDNFEKSLKDGGIIDAFDKKNANFSKMTTSNTDVRLFVSSALHKTHIELNEHGTKAAAVTAFMMENATAMEPEKQKIEIVFNRPFIYIIKEKDNDNIWFFGTVYEPMKYEDNPKCENERF